MNGIGLVVVSVGRLIDKCFYSFLLNFSVLYKKNHKHPGDTHGTGIMKKVIGILETWHLQALDI